MRHPPTRTCRKCGKTWTNAGIGRGGSHPIRYCSAECRDARRRNSNRSNKGQVPVGKVIECNNGLIVRVEVDARGLPYPVML